MRTLIFRKTRLMRFHVFASQSIALLIFSLVLSSSGCGVPELPPRQEAGAPEPIYPKENVSAGSPTKTESQPPATEKAAGSSGNTTKGKTVKAKPGSGKRKPGKAGILMTPINAYFSTKERLAFMQVEDGLKKFRALKGRKPKNFQEVQKEILKPAAIKLPELKPGDTYFFDTNQGPNGTLMVRKAE